MNLIFGAVGDGVGEGLEVGALGDGEADADAVGDGDGLAASVGLDKPEIEATKVATASRATEVTRVA